MLRSFLVFFLVHFTVHSSAQHYKPVDPGSKVHFVIKNFGINTGGDLSGLKGRIEFNPSDLKKSSFVVSVDVKTIDTDNSGRDEHLKSHNYFDIDKYPEIVIQSAKINLTNKSKSGVYYFTGTLTMHGVTKKIEFPFAANLLGQDYLFKGNFEINRKDYGVGGNSGVLGNAVKVSLLVVGKKS